MLEMTEALIHHARFLILRMTGAEFHDIEWSLTTAQNFAFKAGQADGEKGSPKPGYIPAHLRAAYQEGLDDAHLESYYRESANEINEQWAEMKATYPDAKEERFIFCPNGHNCLFTKSGYEECAGCGCLMTEEAEDDYENALIMSGQLM